MANASVGAVMEALNSAFDSIVTVVADSVFDMIHHIEEHLHSVAKVYPTQAAGVNVVAGAAWALSAAIVEVIPASTITSPFDIHFVSVEGLSDNGVYELVLYSGGAGSEVEIGRTRFTKNAVQDGTVNAPMITPVQAANARIGCALACSADGADATFSLMYHCY